MNATAGHVVAEDESNVRVLLDDLFQESRLYTTSARRKELLDFAVRMRAFAPFNAMLLHVQKPGLTYAATAKDWKERFGRSPLRQARPLLVLRPFGPVSLVYDVLDTEGRPIPRGAFGFHAEGSLSEMDWLRFLRRVKKVGIRVVEADYGGNDGGRMRRIADASQGRADHPYELQVNRNHDLPTRFTTLLHELAHLYLGHLGADPSLKIRDRSGSRHSVCEVEAESVAYLVGNRVGIRPDSADYLSVHVDEDRAAEEAGIYQIMWAAGKVEELLELDALIRDVKLAESAPSSKPDGGACKLTRDELDECVLPLADELSFAFDKICLHELELIKVRSPGIIVDSHESTEQEIAARKAFASRVLSSFSMLIFQWLDQHYSSQIDFLAECDDRMALASAVKLRILPELVRSDALVRRYLIQTRRITDGEDSLLDGWDHLIDVIAARWRRP